MKCFSSEVPLITRSFTLRPLLASMLFSTAWWVPCFTAHVVSLAPSTCNRWIRHTNLQLFEFALQSRNFWIRYESGIEWTLNPDIFSSGDITRWSPVLYREYCIQDGNPVPRFSLLPVEKSTLLFAFYFDFGLILPLFWTQISRTLRHMLCCQYSQRSPG